MFMENFSSTGVLGRTWRKTLNERKLTITHSTHICHAAGIEVGGERSHQCAIPATK